MTGIIELTDTALYNKLNVTNVTNLALGGIWSMIAPSNAPLPFVIFQWQGGGDENMTPSRLRNVVYVVKAVAYSKNTATDIDEQVDAALHNQSLTVTGYTNFWCAREDDVAFHEIGTDGRAVYHIGAVYRIRFGQ